MKVGDLVGITKSLSEEQMKSEEYSKFMKIATTSLASNIITFPATIIDIEKVPPRENVTFYCSAGTATWNWDPDPDIHYSEPYGTIFESDYIERHIRYIEISEKQKEYLELYPMPQLDDYNSDALLYQEALHTWLENHQTKFSNIISFVRKNG